MIVDGGGVCDGGDVTAVAVGVLSVWLRVSGRCRV